MVCGVGGVSGYGRRLLPKALELPLESLHHAIELPLVRLQCLHSGPVLGVEAETAPAQACISLYLSLISFSLAGESFHDLSQVGKCLAHLEHLGLDGLMVP